MRRFCLALTGTLVDINNFLEGPFYLIGEDATGDRVALIPTIEVSSYRLIVELSRLKRRRILRRDTKEQGKILSKDKRDKGD